MKHILQKRAPYSAPVLVKASALAGAAILALSLSAGAATAECYADYKAKKGNPLKLHYGIAEIGEGCSVASASAQLSQRLAAQGWTLLNVLSVFDATGLAERKQSAGAYYLRF